MSVTAHGVFFVLAIPSECPLNLRTQKYENSDHDGNGITAQLYQRIGLPGAPFAGNRCAKSSNENHGTESFL